MTVILLALGVAAFFFTARQSIISPLPVSLGSILAGHVYSEEKELQGLLHTHGIAYTAISRSDDDYVISLSPKQQVVITRKKSLSTQISSLQIILPRLTMEGRNFTKVDLRFDKPVIEY
jgi:hypothetical protein